MGRYEELSWSPDFRKSGRSRGQARRYKAFVPDRIGTAQPVLESQTAALCERAGAAVRELNSDPTELISLESLGRQLLRSEALASSQIEGLSVPHRRLAEAELDGHPSPHRALEIVGVIKAIERAIELGAQPGDLTRDAIIDIHRELAVAPPLDRIAGQIREEPSWIGGSQSHERRIRGTSPSSGRSAAGRPLRVHEPRRHLASLPGGNRSRAVRADPPLRRRQRSGRPLPDSRPFSTTGSRSLLRAADQPRPRSRKDAYIAGLQRFRVGKTDRVGHCSSRARSKSPPSGHGSSRRMSRRFGQAGASSSSRSAATPRSCP